MDPVSALSLACNVIQLVECSIETAQVCKELYETGSIDEHNRIEKYTADITAANKDLQVALANGKSSSKPTSKPLRIERAAQDASTTANELKIALSRLKLSKSQGVRRLGGAFKSTLKTLITSGKIKTLHERLERQDAALRSSLLKDLYIKAGRSDLARQKEFKSLSQGQKDIILQTLEAKQLLSTEISTSIKSAETRIAGRLSAQDAHLEFNARQHDLQIAMLREEEFAVCRRRLLKALVFPEINERRNMIEGRVDDFGDTYKWIFDISSAGSDDDLKHVPELATPPDPPTDDSLFSLRPCASGEGDAELRDKLTEAGSSKLEFASPAQASEDWHSNSSEDSLPNPMPIIEGPFEPIPADSRPTSAFVEWLQSDSGLFWISGKPGSGKSTLLDYIYHNLRPERVGSAMLKAWAGADPVVMLTFWFFRPASTSLLKSLHGLWRSLCFQILDADPNLAKIIREDKDGTAPSALKSCLLPTGSSAESWTDNDLKTWFWYIVEHSTVRYFLLMDGLDEMEDGRRLLLDTVLSMSARSDKLKICCSSRPENPFRNTLKNYPNIPLQDFNQGDILKDCERRLKGLHAEKFATKIAERAEGVFLWAHLVSEDLARAAKEGESEEDLGLRLKECPDEMTEMFKYMLLKQDKLYAKRPKPYLRLVDFASSIGHETTVLELLVATLAPGRVPKWLDLRGKFDTEFLSYLEEQLEGLDLRIEATCTGLVQCLVTPGSEEARYQERFLSESTSPRLKEAVATKVIFIHRSVHDFLREDQGGLAYYQRFNISDDEAAKMLMAAALSPFFVDDDKLGTKVSPRPPLYYAEAVSSDGWDAEAMRILDVFFKRLEVRCLPTEEDKEVSYVNLFLVSPDLSLFENLVFGFASMHALDAYVRTKIIEADPGRRKLLAAFALCEYLYTFWNRYRGEMVTTLSPYLDPLQEACLLYPASSRSEIEDTGALLYVEITCPLINHVVAARISDLSGWYDHELDFLRLPLGFLGPYAGTELESSYVEGWLSIGRRGNVDDARPSPSVDCLHRKEGLKNREIAVFHTLPGDILRTDVFPLKIIQWSPAGTTRFFTLNESVQQRFCIAHSPESWTALRRDLNAALVESLNFPPENISKEELEEIKATLDDGSVLKFRENKFQISEEKPFILDKVGGFVTTSFYPQRDGTYDSALFETQVGIALPSNPPVDLSLPLILSEEDGDMGEDVGTPGGSASRPITPLTGLAPSRSITPLRELLQSSNISPRTS